MPKTKSRGPQPQIDVLNSPHGGGDIGDMLMECNGDVNVLRPYKDVKGRNRITVNTGKIDEKGNPVYKSEFTTNAATLRKDEWLRLDRVLIAERRKRLRAYADLRAANTYGGFDGFATMAIEHETIDDPGEAFVDYDGLTERQGATPHFGLDGLPLPIIHAPFWFSSRKLAISRKLGTPLSTTMASIATRRVMETVEKMTIGTLAGPALNVPSESQTYNIYGYTNHPNRITKTNITAPTATSWTGKTLVTEILDMISSLQDDGYYGPYMVYHSPAWSKYLDEDYSDSKGDNTLRQRIEAIDEVQNFRRLDFFGSGYQLLVVEMTEDVARAVNGMEFSMVQWDSKGGFQKNFRVLGIQVPQIRSTINNKTGVAHGTTS